MKIRAIRLKEVGPFQRADRARGPNRRARRAGRTRTSSASRPSSRRVKAGAVRPSTLQDAEIEALRPYAGGAPLIEVDFEIDGTPWRMRKQFLVSRSAELQRPSHRAASRAAPTPRASWRICSGRKSRPFLDGLRSIRATLAQRPAAARRRAVHGCPRDEVGSAAGCSAARSCRPACGACVSL